MASLVSLSTGAKEQVMWRYLLLGIPLVGLVLFFVLSFEYALFLYLLAVVSGFFLYYKLQERMDTTGAAHVDKAGSGHTYQKE